MVVPELLERDLVAVPTPFSKKITWSCIRKSWWNMRESLDSIHHVTMLNPLEEFIYATFNHQ